ncbi:MAG: PH domain-containing protein [Anaerolineae bacterium]|jgi:hypothetical protein
MESFQPDRWVGVVTGTALMLLASITAGAFAWAISQQGVSLVSFLLFLGIIALLFLLALLGYWLYGLARSSFHLDRNALVIQWGATTQVIPMESVSGVLSGQDAEAIVHFRGARWPGLRVGYGEIQDIGPTLFFATGTLQRQVILTTPALAYALSPADPENFIEVVRQRLSMGPTQSVEQASRQPEFLTWSFWSDRLGLALLISALLLLVALFGYISARLPSLAELQPLHFDASGQPDRWGTRVQVFTLPFIGLLALIANSGLGFLLYERERTASYLLWSGSIGVQLLVWGATLGILR